jgi:5-methylcytosine-specific restriction protein B
MTMAKMSKETINKIYDESEKVYGGGISPDMAAGMLSDFVDCSENSLKMYFEIYKCMMNGQTFKRATNIEMIEVFLNQINLKYGKEKLKNALFATYGFIQYLYEKNNQPQPGLRQSCQKIANEEEIDILFDESMFEGIVVEKSKSESDAILESAAALAQNNEESQQLSDATKLSNADFLKWFQPLIEALKDLGGSGTPAEAVEKIISNCKLDNDIISQTRGKNNSNKFTNDVAWARNYLKDEGYIDGSEHGIWKLTERGWYVQMNNELASRIFFKWVEILKCKREGKSISEIDLTIYDKIMINSVYSKADFLSDVFIEESAYDTLNALLFRKKNIILQGAPGVGKTYAAKRLAYSIMGEKDETRIMSVQFHQSYSYEDFIMGYRPDGSGFSLKHGAFYKFCKLAESNPDKPYFFIIDEINRGNLSKIFGELLMLIECDKRGEKMMLTYSETPFSVPENLYIIGMMNTADRSLAIIDYALRRRFCFFELESAFATESFQNHLTQNGVSDVLSQKNIGKMIAVNAEIANDPNLGKGFRIGHSYFCDCKDSSENWYEEIIRYEIAPLLREYWFDETEKAEDFIGGLLR